MKRIICLMIIIAIIIIFCPISSADNDIVFTKCNDEESEKFLWDNLLEFTENEYITAGIMGYFQRESEFRSDAVAGWIWFDLINKYDTSVYFTSRVTVGMQVDDSYDYFFNKITYRYGGYGLGQWLAPRYLRHLYDFTKEWGTSLGDARMQCAFMADSIQNDTPRLWEQIKDDTDVYRIGRKIAYLYDGAGELGAETIASYAHMYFKKYGTVE